MLYTFTVSESGLLRITDYLDQCWQWPGPYDRHIWSVQHLQEDLVFVVVECDDATAVFLALLASG